MSIYSFTVLYAIIGWSEFWIISRLLGNRLHEKAPGRRRTALTLFLFLLPALIAWLILTVPNSELPPGY